MVLSTRGQKPKGRTPKGVPGRGRGELSKGPTEEVASEGGQGVGLQVCGGRCPNLREAGAGSVGGTEGWS